jgi:hypothetical protein
VKAAGEYCYRFKRVDFSFAPDPQPREYALTGEVTIASFLVFDRTPPIYEVFRSPHLLS